MRIAKSIALAMVFTAPPALAAEQAPQQTGTQHDSAHPTRDQRSHTTSSQVKNGEKRATASECTCQQDGKAASRLQPVQDFGETALWPAY